MARTNFSKFYPFWVFSFIHSMKILKLVEKKKETVARNGMCSRMGRLKSARCSTGTESRVILEMPLNLLDFFTCSWYFIASLQTIFPLIKKGPPIV